MRTAIAIRMIFVLERGARVFSWVIKCLHFQLEPLNLYPVQAENGKGFLWV